MKTPIFTREHVEWFEKVFDNHPTKSDKKQDLVWKAAQREVVIRVKAAHDSQSGAKTTMQNMGVNLRGDDD